jgi:hypothetical protein
MHTVLIFDHACPTGALLIIIYIYIRLRNGQVEAYTVVAPSINTLVFLGYHYTPHLWLILILCPRRLRCGVFTGVWSRMLKFPLVQMVVFQGCHHRRTILMISLELFRAFSIDDATEASIA